MSSIDNRIVKMEFDNNQFLANIASTITKLDELKKNLDMSDAEKSFNKIEGASKNVNLDSIAKSLESIKDRFSTFGIIGMQVLQNLTNAAMNFVSNGLQAIGNAIVTGGWARAQNIEQAKFLLQGLISDGAEVQRVLDSASQSVQGTAYGYDVAAKAAAMFATTGIKGGEEMDRVLGAVAGTAATASADYERVAQIFTTIAGNGRVMGNDLIQFSTMGLNAAAILAQSLGKSEAEVRDMVTKGQISFEMFSQAMYDAFGTHAKDANKTFDGVCSNIRASLSRIGAMFFSPMIEQEGALVTFLNTVKSKMADAEAAIQPFATEVTDNLKGALVDLNEYVGQINFGKFIEGVVQGVRNILTALEPVKNAFMDTFNISTDQINGAIDMFVEAQQHFAEFLQGDVGQAIYEVAKTIFDAFSQIGGVIKDVAGAAASAFKNVFEFPGLEKIQSFLAPIKEFISNIKLSESAVSNLQRIFQGVFSALSIGGQLFSGLASVIGNVLQALAPLGEALLEFIANIADVVTGIDQAMKAGEGLNGVFGTVGTAVGGAVEFIGNLAKGIIELATAFLSGLQPPTQFIDKMKEVGQTVTNFDTLKEKVRNGVEAMKQKLTEMTPAFQQAGQVIAKVFGKIAEFIKGFFTGELDLQAAFNNIKSLLQIKFLADINGFVGKLKGTADGLNGIMGSITGMFEKLGDSFSKLGSKSQMLPNAVSWVAIAASIALLATALLTLSKIEFSGLASGLTGMAGVMGELLIFVKLINTMNLKSVAGAASSLIPLSTAMLTFASAVEAFASMDFVSMLQGLLGFAAVLGSVTAVVRVLSGHTKGVMAFSLALIPMAAAMNIFAGAINQFGSMDLSTMIQGLVGFVAVLGSVTAVARVLESHTKGIMAFGLALIPMAAAMNIFADAVRQFGEMDLATMIQGLSGFIVVLASVTTVARVLNGATKGILTFGLALIPMAAAMNIFGDAVAKLGAMDFGSMITGLIGLAAILAMVAGFAAVMKNASIQLLIAASAMIPLGEAVKYFAEAIVTLSGAVQTFGSMDIGSLVQGLLSLAATMGMFIGFTAALKKVSGDLWGMSFALNALAGTLNAMVGAVQTLSSLSWSELIQGLVGLAGCLFSLAGAMRLMQNTGQAAGAMVAAALAIGVLAGSLLIISAIPLAGLITSIAGIAAALLVYTGVAQAVQGAIPAIMGLSAAVLALGVAAAGIGAGVALMTMAFETMIGIFNGGAQQIITFFENLIQVIPLAVQAIVTFITELVTQIAAAAPQVAEAALQILQALLQTFIAAVPQIVEAGMQLILGLLQGINSHIGEIASTALQIIANFITGIASGIGQVIQAAFELVIAFIEGLANAISSNAGRVTAAVGQLLMAILQALAQGVGQLIQGGMALVQGLVQGVGDAIGAGISAVTDFFGGIVDGIKGFFGIASPSTVFQGIGEDCVAGYEQGFSDTSGASEAGQNLGQAAVDGLTEASSGAEQAGVDLSTWATDGLASFQSMFNSVGETNGSEFALGVSGTTTDAQTAGTELGDAANSGFEQSVSRAQELGTQYGQALADSIRASAETLTAAGTEIVNSLATGMQASSAQFQQVGSELMNSLAMGFTLGSPALLTALTSIFAQLGASLTVAATQFQQLGMECMNQLAVGMQMGSANVLIQIQTLLMTLSTSLQAQAIVFQQLGMQCMMMLAMGMQMYMPMITMQFQMMFNQIIIMLQIYGVQFQMLGMQCMMQFGMGLQMGSAMVLPIITMLAMQIVMQLQMLGPQFMMAGTQAMMQFAAGLTAGSSAVIAAVTGVVTAVQAALTSVASQFSTIGQQYMQQLAQGIQSQSGTVTSAASNVGNQLLQQMRSITGQFSPIGQQYMQQMAQGINAQAGTVRTAGSNVGNQLLQQMRSITSQFSPIGQQYMQQLAAGINSGSGQVVNAGKQVVTQVIQAMQGMANQFQQTGQKFMQSLAQGIQSSSNTVNSACRSIVSSAVGALGGMSGQFRSVGVNAGAALAAGLESQLGRVRAAAQALAQAAAAATAAAAKIKSPSRVFIELGKLTGEGYSVGLAKSGDTVSKGITEMFKEGAEKPIRSSLLALSNEFKHSDLFTNDGLLNGSIKRMSNLLDAMDVDTTIRPNIDLTGVRRDAREINAIFDQINDSITVGTAYAGAGVINRAVSRMSASTGTENGGKSQVINNSYVQNITSPKAVDRLTIYRQSRNLFARAKGPVNVNA